MRHDRIIDLFGGNQIVADLVGKHNSAVSRWRKDGIPPVYWPFLARVARRRRLKDIDMEDFVAGLPPASRYRIKGGSNRPAA
jgi:hypothetical protein